MPPTIRSFAIFFSILLFSASSLSNDATTTPMQISSGSWYEIASTTMGENRRYAVHLPPSYSQDKDKRYPVLYVLDGSATRMRGVSGMIESLSNYDLGQQIPEFIVVAIPNTNRNRDLTPTDKDLAFKGQVLDKLAGNSGGADVFATFIRKELFPRIDAQFRTTQQRGLLGMSFGGLFAGHVLLTQPDMFSDYLIADATFVWDDNYLNRTLASSLEALAGKSISVFIGLANNDHLGELGMTNRQWGNDFITSLNAIESDNLKVASRYFPQEQHGTVMFLAFYHGLIELFRQQKPQ